MSEITHIIDYETRLVDLLLGQFKTQTNWLSLFSAIFGEGQLLENTIYSLWQQRIDLTLAAGWQLDQWGKVVGIARASLSDGAYRALIEAHLQAIRSKGTPNELLSIIDALTTASSSEILEFFPATVTVQYQGDISLTDPNRATIVLQEMTTAKSAGVHLVLVEYPTLPFGFDGDSSAGGFEDIVSPDPTAGTFSKIVV